MPARGKPQIQPAPGSRVLYTIDPGMSDSIPDNSSTGSEGSPATLTATSAAPATPHPTPVHGRTGIGVWLRDLIISLAISAFIIIFLYQPVKVEGVSMMPSLEDQERIFVNKFVYRLEPIERGDIVVFRYPR